MLIYGSATIGGTVHFHYCMNKFVEWSLMDNSNDTCGKCGMDDTEKSGCCKDEHKHFKLSVDHQKTATQNATINSFSQAIIANEIETTTYHSDKFLHTFNHNHAPPDIGNTALHVFHCLFLI